MKTKVETQAVSLLAQSLLRVQAAEGLTTPQMARRLGISWRMLQWFYKGERLPGRKVLGAILKHYPGMSERILEDLRG